MKKLKVVPVELIRYSENGATLSPTCLQDIPADSTEVKWQKSDLGSDGYFPAKILCFGGTVESTIATAKVMGHKLGADSVLLEPLRTKLLTPESPKEKNDRKSRALIKRKAPISSEDPVRSKKKRKAPQKEKRADVEQGQSSKQKKKKAPLNKLAADPIVAARLKDALDLALTSNPLCLDHLSKLEKNDASLQDGPLKLESIDQDVQKKASESVFESVKAQVKTAAGKPSLVKPPFKSSPVKSPFESSPVVSPLKPSPAKCNFKPSPAKAQFKPSPARVQFKPSPAKVQFKPSPVKVQFKPSPAKVQFKSSPAKAQFIPSPAKSATQDVFEGNDADLNPTPVKKTLFGISSPGESVTPSTLGVKKSSDSFSEDDDSNTTVKASSDSSPDPSSEDSSEGSSGSNDPVCKLSDDKEQLRQKLLTLKLENQNLKTQLSVVWGEKKKVADASEKTVEALKEKLIKVQEELKHEKSRNFALQEALVKTSSSHSVSRTLHFGKSAESPKHSGTTDLSDPSLPPNNEEDDKSKGTAPDQKKDSKKQKSGKKYIESNALPIDSSCQKVLSYLNKTEIPILDKKGNVDIGNDVVINYKGMMDILRSKTEPETMARNLTLLTWDSKERASRSLDGKISNRYPNAPKKAAATPSKVNSILGAVKASLLKAGSQEGPMMSTTLFACRRGIGNRFNETSNQSKKSPN
ncbi:nucleolar protein dao-5-like [Thrips palmi]|uniref:Nucleolar protein dao-5-like n=1 Tax=Thrips palmi TaxID=161013 RepID=A0A6P8ZUM1_THRPL|nr:nucleolar protein dao-5-like [Thrips palmi]